MPKIVITRKIPGNVVNDLKNLNYEVVVGRDDRPMNREELLTSIQGSDGVLTQLQDKVDEQFLQAAGPNLKIIANYAVGFDNFDLKAIKEHNIIATNTPDVLTEAVAEHTIALILAVARRIVEADFLARKQDVEFGPDVLLGTELKGKILAILGSGRIGARVAEIAKAFGMSIVYYDIKQNLDLENRLNAKFYSTVEDILPIADIVSIHVPLIDSTFHLINQNKLCLMKNSSYIINTSRGGVIDEVALTQALKSNQIRGAGLDVFEHEPKLSIGLELLNNVVLTPHIASATYDARIAMSKLAIENLVAVISGNNPITEIKC